MSEKVYKIDKIRERLLKFCEGNVLETGVGTGINLPYYPNTINSFIGVDYSLKAIEQALYKPTLFSADFKLCDVENLEFEDNTFDTVVDTFGLEYYYNPKQAIKEMKRVCKKDGKILILANGISNNYYLNLYKRFITPQMIIKKGYYPSRNWEDIIENDKDFEVEVSKKMYNESLYFYVLKNIK